ncbi:DUF2254 domain-containing protein [Cardiobacteriaceae bacterium TAE3-ERU3]|nr:DUF2254 domain-containing protein [Cardiobacteriaceae bacterium TAE3-ERU3]
MYRFWLWLRRPQNTLWATPALGALFAITMAALAAVMPRFLLPQDFSFPDIQLETIDDLLDVLSSSMLAVTTFSLSIMVSAFASASSGATPRATQLVMADDNTRVAIASFISAFIYAVIAKTALGMGYYHQNGRFVLFVATVLVLIYLIITLIRWVFTLSQLGRMSNTIRKIEQQAKATVATYRAEPFLGAAGTEPDGEPVMWLNNHETGYLTHINMAMLNELASAGNYRLHITVRPGKLLYPGDTLAKLYGYEPQHQNIKALRDCFVVQDNRSYDQDPRYGLIILSEVAQRALSPAVNDPGTAIKIMTVLANIMISVKPSRDGQPEVPYYRLSIEPLVEQDLIVQPFDPMLRDGAGNLDIAERGQKILAAIWRHAPEQSIREVARWQAKRALDYHEASDMLVTDKSFIREVHHRLFIRSEHGVVDSIWQFDCAKQMRPGEAEPHHDN